MEDVKLLGEYVEYVLVMICWKKRNCMRCFKQFFLLDVKAILLGESETLEFVIHVRD